MTDEARARFRAVRADISAAEQDRRASALGSIVTRLPWWRDAHRLGVYRAVGGEIDPAALVANAWTRGIETYVPVLAGERLQFARCTGTTRWERNRFGIDEPADVEPVDPTILDLVLVPAVAVDATGHRLGMGGGFYDRTFAERPRPFLVATVHPEQLVDALPSQPWDVPMDAILTPDDVIVTGASGGC